MCKEERIVTFLVLALLIVISLFTSLLFIDKPVSEPENIYTDVCDTPINSDIIFEDETITISEAKIPGGTDCLFRKTYNLLRFEPHPVFNTDHSQKRSYQNGGLYGSDISEIEISVGDTLFTQSNDRPGDYLYNISIENEKEPIFKKRIATAVCGMDGHLSYTVANGQLYITYLDVRIIDGQSMPEIDHRFFKVEDGKVVDLDKDDRDIFMALYNVGDKLLYFYTDHRADDLEQSDPTYGINYDGTDILHGRYDQILDGCACEPAFWRIRGDNNRRVEFYSKKGDEYYFVKIEKKQN